jgi:hypothetical protein
MKTLIPLFAIFLSLSLTAQTNPATWYSNDTSGSGIQSPTNTASGYASTAMGEGTTASGSRSTAMGRGTTASGNYSTAMGYYTTASISYSTAMGHQTTASGYVSTAMGTQTTASGSRSTAMGEGTIASGNYSTAMGLYTIASDRSSLVIGEYNLLGSTVTNSATQFSTDNTAFVIGNGADSDNRSDALTVLFNGDATLAGSMTATSFIGDGSQLTNLPSSGADSPFSYNSNELGGIEVANYTIASGSNAFAVGNDNLASGSSSTAMGRGTIASGDDSTAMGANTEASGSSSTAIGLSTTASGDVSTAMGLYSIASGDYSVAIGYGSLEEGNFLTGTPYYRNEAIGIRSHVIGNRNKSTGSKSFSIGNDNLSQGTGAFSVGENNISTGDYSMALGLFSESVAYGSFSFGNNAYADGYNTTAIGSANTVDDSAIADQWNQNNRAFVIGNGFYDIDNAQLTRSDAFTVWFNGDATLAGNLNINSDARLKANIVSLGSTLAKLLQIDGKSYTMKKDESEKQKIGLLAQDIEKVFPELVSESNGIKSVNYQGLVPVLINALKEQEERIKRLEELLLD